MNFGLIVIGDEILSGRRQDRHVEYFRNLLISRGFRLHWVQILPDEPGLLVKRLKASMQEGNPVFCCGGIGATPDDYTRQCAAEAAGVAYVRHEEAAKQLEELFGPAAYPNRIRMADLPQGASLIPNPYNRVPGFSINQHYFMPGFPDMAHPMGEWVLDTYYPGQGEAIITRSVKIRGQTENELMALMEELVKAYPKAKLFSLPRIGADRYVELGFSGTEQVEEAFARLKERLGEMGVEW